MKEEKKKERKSKNREDLPQLLKYYLLILEGQMDTEELRLILAPDVRFSRDAKKWVNGFDAVRGQIDTWLETVSGTQIEMLRMLDHGDGCVKVDFVAHTHVRDGDTSVGVALPVMAMYMIDLEANRISDILEHWAQVPPQARSYQ